MEYTTTRSSNVRATASEAILKGLGDDGGLYLPLSIPHLQMEELEALAGASYQEVAKKILGLFLTDFTPEEISYAVDKAYNPQTFQAPDVTPVSLIGEGTGILELYHGPTAAFKDVALQILPHLLTISARKNGDQRTYVILVATSGDTGKAALEGFRDVPGTKILVFYPKDGVSTVQKLQMVTQEGDNLGVLAVEGNFDDTQNGVKALFQDDEIARLLAEGNYTFSSANSINWGRLAPQIVYYFYSYLQMARQGQIALGEEVNFTVPTGNFGNILAGYYAKEMGLPIHRLICAANANNVLTDFIRTGIYDRNRPFHKTLSPSMDILISSNLERLLHLLSQEDSTLVSRLMARLKEDGRYEIPHHLKEKIQEVFFSSSKDDRETLAEIRRMYQEHGYLMDTHTAVAWGVARDYKEESGDARFQIILSTASPYKFVSAVGDAILAGDKPKSELELLLKIQEQTEVSIPSGLQNLEQRPLRFTQEIQKEDMPEALLAYLQLNR